MPRGRETPPCTVDGCTRLNYGNGLCALHYQRMAARGTTDARERVTVCTVDDCAGQVKARGLCKPHYQRWQRSGSTDLRKPELFMTPIQRIHAKARLSGDCWLWTGAVDAGGYAHFRHDGRTQKAHRVVWELLNGAVPDGLELDHLCNVRHCVNPAHLEPVTHAENMRRARARRAAS